MSAIRLSKRGVMRRYGDSPGSDDHTNLWNAQDADNGRLASQERTPSGMTFPHWAGCRQYAGQAPITAHGETASLTPYIRSLKKKEED